MKHRWLPKAAILTGAGSVIAGVGLAIRQEASPPRLAEDPIRPQAAPQRRTLPQVAFKPAPHSPAHGTNALARNRLDRGQKPPLKTHLHGTTSLTAAARPDRRESFTYPDEFDEAGRRATTWQHQVETSSCPLPRSSCTDPNATSNNTIEDVETRTPPPPESIKVTDHVVPAPSADVAKLDLSKANAPAASLTLSAQSLPLPDIALIPAAEPALPQDQGSVWQMQHDRLAEPNALQASHSSGPVILPLPAFGPDSLPHLQKGRSDGEAPPLQPPGHVAGTTGAQPSATASASPGIGLAKASTAVSPTSAGERRDGPAFNALPPTSDRENKLMPARPDTLPASAGPELKPRKLATGPGSTSAAGPAPTSDVPGGPSGAVATLPRESSPALRGQLPVPLFGQATDPGNLQQLATQQLATKPVPRASAGQSEPGLPSLAQGEQSAAKTQRPSLGSVLLASDVPRFTDDDELILSLRTSSGELDETISAFGIRQGVYLPLGELARLFDLPLRVSDDGHYVSGWVLDPARTLVLNLRAGEGAAAGKSFAVPRSLFATYLGETYVRADALPLILPVSVKVDLRDQAVIVTTLEKFPFQARLERDAERQRLASRKGAVRKEDLPLEPAPWGALSVPVGDVEARAVSDDTLGTRLELEIRAAADIAFLTARGFLEASSRDGVTGVRLEFGRRDPTGTLLGPLGATQFAFGDIATVSQSIGLRSVAGRGLFLSNAPLDQTSVFDRVDLRGPLPDGYEVELYRNNVLVGASASPVNGQYEFLQVPLDFGANILRLVFYGPQGQTREEVRRYNVGNGRLASGDFVYDVGVVQKDSPLVAARPPLYLSSAGQGQWRATGNLAYGVSSRLTLSAGLALTWNNRGRTPGLAGNVGIRSEIAGLPVLIDGALQQGGAKALRSAIAARVAGFGLALTHAQYRGGFIDEVQAFEDTPLRQATSLDLSGTLPIGTSGLPLIGRMSRLAFADGRVIRNASLRTSVRFGNALLSPAIEYSASGAAIGKSELLAATFDLALFAGSRTRLRASSTVDLTSPKRLTQVSGQVDHSLSGRDTLRLSASHSFAAGQSQIGASFRHQFARASLALDASTGFPTRSHYLGLRLSAGFVQNPFSRRMEMAMPGISANGVLAARVYRDDNANGALDVGESPIQGASLLVSGRDFVTDESGVALVPALGDGLRATYAIDEESLPDIDLAPARKGGAFVARVGRVHKTDLPVVTLSDIGGEAILAQAGARKGVSGLQLVLRAANGAVAATARSRSGGSFFFERVPPGSFRIEIAAEQATRLGITPARPVYVEVSGKNQVPRIVMEVLESHPD